MLTSGHASATRSKGIVSAEWGGEKWARFTERPVVCEARGAKAFLRKQLPCSGREPFHSRVVGSGGGGGRRRGKESLQIARIGYDVPRLSEDFSFRTAVFEEKHPLSPIQRIPIEMVGINDQRLEQL